MFSAGCATCKVRRIKCDESVPGCLNCSKQRLKCPGYSKRLQWKEKHQFSIHATSGEDGDRRLSEETKTHDLIEDSPGRDRQAEAESRAILLPAEHSAKVSQWSAPLHGASVIVRSCSSAVVSSAAVTKRPTGLRPFRSLTNHDKTAVLLVEHYFRKVCVISSCFDSIANPFRTEIPALMATSRLVRCCILSMSAAHLRSLNHPRWSSLDSLQYLTATV